MRKKVFRGTWCERQGTSTAYHLTKSGNVGKRIVVMIWDDAPHVAEVQAMTGSFWRSRVAGVIFEKVRIMNATPQQVLEEVERLAEKHFGWKKT